VKQLLNKQLLPN